MKARTKALEVRLAKLELVRNPPPVPRYVVVLSHDEWKLPEADKLVIIRERSGGRRVVVMPEKCADFAEWMERYAKPGLERAPH